MSILSDCTFEFSVLRNLMLDDAGSMLELAEDFAAIGGSVMDGVCDVPSSVDSDAFPHDEVCWIRHHAREVLALADGVRASCDSLDAFFIAQEFSDELRAVSKIEFTNKFNFLYSLAQSLNTLAAVVETKQARKPFIPEEELQLCELALGVLFGVDEDDAIRRVYHEDGSFSHFTVTKHANGNRR